MLVLWGVLVFVYHLGMGIYYARGLEPLPTFEFLYQGAFICGLVWWLRAEARKSPLSGVYCEGLLFGAAWLFIIPYHLLKSRGVKGGVCPLSSGAGFSWAIAHRLMAHTSTKAARRSRTMRLVSVDELLSPAGRNSSVRALRCRPASGK